MIVAGTPFGLPMLQFLVCLLDYDDSGVNHGSDGNGDSAQRHDVGRQPHRLHRNEGQNNRDRNGDDGDDRAREMPQEDQDDQTDDEQLFHQRVLKILDRAVDQLRAVIGVYKLQPRRQGRLNITDPCLDALNHLLSILAEAHDHDAANRLPFAIQFADAASHVRPECNRRYVADPHWRTALRIYRNNDIADVVERLDIAPSAHHVLAAGKLDQPAADIVVRFLNRVGHHVDRDLVAEQSVRIDVDLVLPHKSADRHNLGDSGN